MAKASGTPPGRGGGKTEKPPRRKGPAKWEEGGWRPIGIPPDPAELAKRAGRSSILTWELLLEVYQGLLTGAPLIAVCNLVNLSYSVAREWKEIGEADLKAKKDTLYATFAAGVGIAVGHVEVNEFWGAITRAAREGTIENERAANIAIKALSLRFGKRYGKHLHEENGQKQVPAASPAQLLDGTRAVFGQLLASMVATAGQGGEEAAKSAAGLHALVSALGKINEVDQALQKAGPGASMSDEELKAAVRTTLTTEELEAELAKRRAAPAEGVAT